MTEKLEKFRLTIKMGDKKLIFFRPVGVTGIANHILGQPPSDDNKLLRSSILMVDKACVMLFCVNFRVGTGRLQVPQSLT